MSDNKESLKKLSKKEQTEIIHKLTSELGVSAIVPVYEDARIELILSLREQLEIKNSSIIISPEKVPAQITKPIIVEASAPVIIEPAKEILETNKVCDACKTGLLLVEGYGNSGISYKCSNPACNKGITRSN